MKRLICTTLLAGLAVASFVWLCVVPSPNGGEQAKGRAAIAAADGLIQSGNRQDDVSDRDSSSTPETTLERLKETLDASPREWQTIGPLLEDILDKQPAFSGGGSLAGRPGASIGNSPAAEALLWALEDEDTPAGEIEYILRSLQYERKRAREALREVLTIRQEARLVLLGVLD